MDISVIQLKGGVGKTTTAIHLAHYLQQYDTTVVIDADKNCSALQWASHGKLLFEVCNVEASLKYVRKAKHIVADTKARPEPEDIKAVAEEFDLLIVPTPPRALDLDALLKTRDILVRHKAKFKALLTITPPPRKRPGGSKLLPSKKEREAREFLELEEIPSFECAIYQYSAIEKSPLIGVTVDEYEDDYSQAAWQCYKNLGKEVFSG